MTGRTLRLSGDLLPLLLPRANRWFTSSDQPDHLMTEKCLWSSVHATLLSSSHCLQLMVDSSSWSSFCLVFRSSVELTLLAFIATKLVLCLPHLSIKESNWLWNPWKIRTEFLLDVGRWNSEISEFKFGQSSEVQRKIYQLHLRLSVSVLMSLLEKKGLQGK